MVGFTFGDEMHFKSNLLIYKDKTGFLSVGVKGLGISIELKGVQV